MTNIPQLKDFCSSLVATDIDAFYNSLLFFKPLALKMHVIESYIKYPSKHHLSGKY